MKLSHIAAGGFIVLLVHVTGWATTVIKMDLSALVEQSESIVQGKVEHVESAWDEQRKTIFTSVSVIVNEGLKGTPQSRIVVRQLGGKLGAMNLSVVGMPPFHEGEEVILFLRRSSLSDYHVIGLSQGKFTVTEGFVSANTSGIELLDRTAGKVVEGGISGRETLAAFKSRIRSLTK